VNVHLVAYATQRERLGELAVRSWMTWVGVGGLSTGSGFESRSPQMVLSRRKFGEVGG